VETLPLTRLKLCPLKSCRGAAKLVEQILEVDGAEYLRSRVICMRCGLQGPWGNAPGAVGVQLARDLWNSEWGRDDG